MADPVVLEPLEPEGVVAATGEFKDGMDRREDSMRRGKGSGGGERDGGGGWAMSAPETTHGRGRAAHDARWDGADEARQSE